MSNWYLYIAKTENDFISGVCNDLINEELLLKDELKNNNFLIGYYQEFNNKIECLKKLQEINSLSDDEKNFLILTFNKIIVIKDDEYKENYDKYPLVYNLKQTFKLSSFFQENGEIWKLNQTYMEHVSEYLAVERSKVEFMKLWNIAVDFSANVGLVTKNKFFPIIKN